MKKPFKLNAYYLVNMDKVEHCNALADLGIKPEGKAVVFLDDSKYCIDADGDIKVLGQAQWLLANHERKACKRCDNAFVLGVTYIDSNGEEFICTTDTEGRYVLHDVSNPDNYYWCQDNDPKQFTPKVGMIN